MKDQLISYIKTQAIIFWLAIFINFWLMIELASLEDSEKDCFRKFPGIDIKEF